MRVVLFKGTSQYDDPAAAFAQARAGKARVLSEHTWDTRIGLVLQAAGL